MPDQPSHEFLHVPEHPSGIGLVLTHGAGSDHRAQILVTVANAFCDAGVRVVRCDLAFRRKLYSGPPTPAKSPADRAVLRDAVLAMRQSVAGPVWLSGHSYGGRQATMLAAEEPGLVDGLLLFSYPLHPPGQPHRPRTEHFPSLTTRAIFVHGTKDDFGTPDEMQSALALVPSNPQLLIVERAGHDLKKGKFDMHPVVSAITS